MIKRKYLLLSITIFYILIISSNATIGTESTQTTDNNIEYSLGNMHTHPEFITVSAASIIGWALGIGKGENINAKKWLKKFSSKTPKWIEHIFNFIIFAVVGAYCGTGIYKPIDFTSALAAGFAWPLGLTGLAASPKDDKIKDTETNGNKDKDKN